MANKTGTSAAETLTGTSAADVIKGLGGKDIIDGLGGSDFASYAEKTTALIIALNGASNSSVRVNGVVEDTIRNIENIVGGSAADKITGDRFANTFRGGLGKDILDGRAGSDTLDYTDKTSAVQVTLSGSTSATVKVGGVAEDSVKNFENILGGKGADNFTGDNAANKFRGGAGTDRIDGGGGFDTASFSDKTASLLISLNGSGETTVQVGGVGEDTLLNIENIIGGSGNDTILGDDNKNVLRGGAGNDLLDGGDGTDRADYSDKSLSVSVTLAGSQNASVRVNGVIEDTLRNIENLTGGKGDDSFVGDAFDNAFKGGAGQDTIDGGDGSDSIDLSDKKTAITLVLNDNLNVSVLVNGAVEDTIRDIENIIAGSGADTITGDSADNRIRGNKGADILDGGTGVDTADYSDKTKAIEVALNASVSGSVTVKVEGVAEDQIKGFENVIGGSGNDILTGNNRLNTFSGGAGNDTLNGGSAADTLNGERGDDTIIGSFGDTIDGGSGIDTLDYSAKVTSVELVLKGATLSTNFSTGDKIVNVENLIGGSSDDTLTGDSFGNKLEGRAGNDRLKAGAGDGDVAVDILDGGDGSDTADFSDFTADLTLSTASSAVTKQLIDGASTVNYTNIENLVSGSGNDTLKGDNQNNRLEGNSGNDTLNGFFGRDTLLGGSFSDTLNGGLGSDTLTGGSGSDAFIFNTALSSSLFLIPNIDTITDYNISNDRIHLDDSIFTGLTVSSGLMSSGNFRANSAGVAADATDRIIYETDTGKLFYDRDGSGDAAKVQFAVLSSKPVIDHLDFLII